MHGVITEREKGRIMAARILQATSKQTWVMERVCIPSLGRDIDETCDDLIEIISKRGRNPSALFSTETNQLKLSPAKQTKMQLLKVKARPLCRVCAPGTRRLIA